MTKKSRPTSTRTLVQALNKGTELDGRTNLAKSIREVRTAIQDDLAETSKALLEHDASTAAVVQQYALKEAFKDPNSVIKTNGKPHYALGTWMKFAQVKRTSLLALRKFQETKPEEEAPKTLADIVIASDSEDQSSSTNGHRPKSKQDWRFGLRHAQDFKVSSERPEDN